MLNTNEKLEFYVQEHSSPEDKVLYELYRKTNLYAIHPRMLSGHIQGKLLEMVSYMIRPHRVLEIGTYTGYSAICLAKGIPEDGKLHTIEINDELHALADKYFKKAGLLGKIIQHSGDALDIIPELNEKFDLVFIDADKKQYPEYYECIFPYVVTGGFILVDNVLWSGKVVDAAQKDDPDTKAIKQFNTMIKKDKRVENVILPLRDGLTLVRKLSED